MVVWNDSTDYRYFASAYELGNVASRVESEDDLAQYTNKSWDGFDEEIVPSIKLSIENEMLVATVQIADGHEPNETVTMEDGKKQASLSYAIMDWLIGQYSDGWGEGFEQTAAWEETDEVDCSYEDEETGEWIPDSYDEKTYYYISPYYHSCQGQNFHFEKFEII
jgi:hypothetical protein